MRYLETFDREKVLKTAKGELALQNIPLTDENIEEKIKDLYKEWLAWKLQDSLHKDDGVKEFSSFYRLLNRISSKYCVIIEQWLYNKSLHYQGKYFTFEEIYNVNVANNIGIFEELMILVKCIHNFEEFEKNIDTCENLTQKDIKEFKNALDCQMNRNFFYD